MSDSLIRTRQINQIDLSGYIVQVINNYLNSGIVSGINLLTGQLTGQFYPLNSNPDYYVTTGQTGVLATQSYVNNANNGWLVQITTTGLGNYLQLNAPNSGNLSLSDSVTNAQIIDFISNNQYILNSSYGDATIVLSQNYPINKPYISGFNFYSGNIFTTGINGQFPVTPSWLSANYVPLWEFNTVNWSGFQAFLLSSSCGTSFTFNTGCSAYNLVGSNLRNNNPYVIDMLGLTSGTYGVQTNNPFILGFDIFAGNLYSNGSPVITTNSTGGLVAYSQLLSASGSLINQFYTWSSGVNTGQLTGAFYPLNSNPGNYVTLTGLNTFTNANAFSQALTLNAGAILNNFIYDFNEFEVVGIPNRQLYNAIGQETVDFNNLILTGGIWTGQGFSISGSSVVLASQTGQFTTVTHTGYLTGAFASLYSNNTLTGINIFKNPVYISGAGFNSYIQFGNLNHNYIYDASGYVILNVGVLFDGGGNPRYSRFLADSLGSIAMSFTPSARQLFDRSGFIAVDFNNRILSGDWTITDSNAVPVIQAHAAARILLDSTGNSSVDFANRKLTGGNWDTQGLTISGQQVITTGQTGVLTGSFAQLYINNTFSGINLYMSGNGTFGNGRIQFVHGAYDNGVIYDSQNNKSLDWVNRNLNDTFGNISHDYTNRFLYSTGGVFSIDYSNRILFDSNSFEAINYSGRILSGIWSVQSLFISGVSVSTGGNVNTGQLTGAFYPLHSNPAGYVTSTSGGSLLYVNGQFLTSGNFVGVSGTVVAISGSNVLIAGGSSTNQTYNQTGAYIYQTSITSGLNSQFIYFPINLGSSPTILTTLNSPTSGSYYSQQISGVNSSGFWVLFSDVIDANGYILNTIASISTGTGLATTVISNNYFSGGSGTAIQVTGSNNLSTGNFSGVSGINLFLSGSSLIVIDGGAFITNSLTGQFNNVFYPLNSNPAGYLTGITGITNYSQSGAYIFQTIITSGVTNQYISFPTPLGISPTVLTTLDSPANGNIIAQQTSGITPSGFWIVFSDQTDTTGYTLHTLASLSSGTGLATTVIINNNTYYISGSGIGGSGTNVQISSSSTLVNANFSGVSGINLFLSGTSSVIIDGGAFIKNNNTGNFVTQNQTSALIVSNITLSGSNSFGAGIYTFQKTIGSGTSANICSFTNNYGMQMFHLGVSCEQSGFCVGKMFSVIAPYSSAPIINMINNSGPYNGNDFYVNLNNTGTSGTLLNITNNGSISGTFISTIFLFGSQSPIIINQF